MGLKVILADNPEWLALFSFLYKIFTQTNLSELPFCLSACCMVYLLSQ